MENFLKWRTSHLREEDGVIVGADLSQEWMLPWWWKHYEKHNSHPVAFVDFGMSYEKKSWCKERGELIPLRIFDFVASKEEMEQPFVNQLEEEFGNKFWDLRGIWFKKPLALLQSPFKRSIWIDIDCEIRGPIQDLFAYADHPPGIAMVLDQCPRYINHSPPMYNSGVIPYHHNCDLIVEWARGCLEQNSLFRGDQEVFSQLIAEKKLLLSTPAAQYNWSRIIEEDGNVVILHWYGAYGKFIIRNQINMEEMPF